MRLALASLLVLVLLLQHKLWFSDVGVLARQNLSHDVVLQQERQARLKSRNDELTRQIVALHSNLDAIESRARRDLGMVREGEDFYFVPSAPTSSMPGEPALGEIRIPGAAAGVR